jgi:hypothetical protein
VKAPKNDVPDHDFDEEFWEEDPPVVPIVGGVDVAQSGGIDDLSMMLLDMISATAKLAVLLAEADETEHKVVAGRRQMLQTLIAGLPSQARPSKRIGFLPPPVEREPVLVSVKKPTKQPKKRSTKPRR